MDKTLAGSKSVHSSTTEGFEIIKSKHKGLGNIKNRYQRLVLVGTLALNDSVMLAIALLGAWYVRIGSGVLAYNSPTNAETYVQMTAVAVVVFLTIFSITRLYDYELLLGGPQEYNAVFRACSYGMVAIVIITFMQRSDPLSRGWLLIAWGLSIVLVGGSRFLWRRFFFWLRRSYGWLSTPTIIVGADEHGRAIARQLSGDLSGINLVGFVDDFLPEYSPVVNELRVLGSPKNLNEIATQYGIEQVIVVSNALSWESFQDIIRGASEYNGYSLQLSPGFYEILTNSVTVTHKGFVPLLRIEQARITGSDQLLKTAFDYGLGIFLTILFLPLMILIWLIIRIVDGSTPFERHEVLGMGGQRFHTIKFRTGFVGITKRHFGVDPQKSVDSGLIETTRIGQLLYRSGLDKLPQLFDVLRGRMCLVGPRTISISDQDEYRGWLPNLISVKPGWTGPWSVSQTESLEDEMRLAMYYIRNWTIWLDIQILFRTALMVISGKVRYRIMS